jgi:putative peptide zinc metalloprotease protein
MTDIADQPLPPLREDLRLNAAAAGGNGAPAWVIEDFVVNRFYRIGWLEFECLLRWHLPPRVICEQIHARTALRPEVGQVLDLQRFLMQHHLLRTRPQAMDRAHAQDHGPAWLRWKWWLHHYLFFRVALLHPQHHLQRWNRVFGWLFNPWTAVVVMAASLLGVILVLHQWDTFRHAVVESFSREGLLSFALALIVAKSLHELGHALVATRLGLRVGHMGIAFVVLWPMLYTDTGQTWRLRSARQRLAIASAGIVTELSLAGLSTLGWALCDPGPLRNGLLYLATTSWLLSLALNASPFMRFDGYFILSDLLDFPNLHERASAMARVALRRWVAGFEEDWPEPFSSGRRRWLITFAALTWLYRLVLFLGIAYAVYLLFFKLLGIVLFSVELCWFIGLPVYREMKHWWAQRHLIPARRRGWSWATMALLLLLLAVPWRADVDADGVARAEHQLRVYAPYPARLQSIKPEGQVLAGDTLAILDDPDIASRAATGDANARSYEARLAGLIADPAGYAEAAATRQRRGVQIEEARSARSEIARLSLKSAFAGVWMDTNPDLQAGQWVGSDELLGVLIDPATWQVDAYVAQDQVQHLALGNRIRFYPDGQPGYITGTLLAIGSARANRLSHRMLSAHFGGPVATAPAPNELAPTGALFQLLVQLDAPLAEHKETRGHLKISGERRSVISAAASSVFAVFLRESGF